MDSSSVKAMAACAAVWGWAVLAQGAFVVQIDIDGANNAAVTYSPNFSFGGDTTTASASSPSTAVGLNPNANSIFGGNGSVALDTYQYNYTPSQVGGDADNTVLAGGTALNTIGDVASGQTAGLSGLYAVYAAWPTTTNVSGGLTLFEMAHDGGTLSVQVDQNALSNQWIPLGTVELTEGNSYLLVQTAGSNTFVSMRSSGVMFDRIPEPGSTSLLALAGGLLAMRRRRAARRDLK